MNEFFMPTASTQFRRLVRLFVGELEGEIADWKIAKSRHTFRQIVYRDEMQPDQWPKYKYLLLEIWRPENETLKASLDSERTQCRSQTFKGVHEAYKKDYLRDHTKNEDDLGKKDHKEIFDQAYDAFIAFLKIINEINDIPEKRDADNLLKGRWEDVSSENEDEDAWGDVEASAASDD